MTWAKVQGYVGLTVACFGLTCGGKLDGRADDGSGSPHAGGAKDDGTAGADSLAAGGRLGKSSTSARGGTAGADTARSGGSTATPTQTATGGKSSAGTGTARCGNGKVDLGEDCDDGNRWNGDGCSSSCTIDDPFRCMPFVAVYACGNGKLEPGESCDDANANSGDGCAETCKNEAGYRCPTPGKTCVPITDPSPRCGNGIVEMGEACDDGVNDGRHEGCSPDCATRAAYCGDGVKNGSEQCDSGSANMPADEADYGSCLLNCQLGPHCGDGIAQTPIEDCDVGLCNGAPDYSSCSNDCFNIVLQ
ncbi:MAG TPA: DUF4215 domain-containing protein [Polyangiaceae bacterium]